jgi:hypothetical protein
MILSFIPQQVPTDKQILRDRHAIGSAAGREALPGQGVSVYIYDGKTL